MTLHLIYGDIKKDILIVIILQENKNKNTLNCPKVGCIIIIIILILRCNMILICFHTFNLETH